MTTHDDIQSHLSIRNLEQGGGPRSPLRVFKGQLESVTTEVQEKYGRLLVNLNFIDVDAVESVEPYDFPIAQVQLPYSRRAKSRWGIFSESLVKLVQGDQDILDAIGARLTLAWTEGHMLYDGREEKDVAQGAWEVISLENIAQASRTKVSDGAMALLDGKTLAQFNSAALADPVIRSDAAVQKAILARKFVADLLERGLASVDADGIHHTTAE